MQEHEDVTKEMLTKDVIWDAPPILTRDRDDLRVAAYLAKSIAYLTLYPRLVQASCVGCRYLGLRFAGLSAMLLLFPTLLLGQWVSFRKFQTNHTTMVGAC